MGWFIYSVTARFAVLEKKKVAAGRVDMENYASAWNGVGPDVSTRRMDPYNEIEHRYQFGITDALSKLDLDAAPALADAKAMLANDAQRRTNARPMMRTSATVLLLGTFVLAATSSGVQTTPLSTASARQGYH